MISYTGDSPKKGGEKVVDRGAFWGVMETGNQEANLARSQDRVLKMACLNVELEYRNETLGRPQGERPRKR